MLRLICFCLSFLLTAAVALADPVTLEARWTQAARAAAIKSRQQVRLPEVRVYDAQGRLLLRNFGGGQPGTIVPRVVAALRAGKAVPGPGLAETMHALETRDGRAVLPQLGAGPRSTIGRSGASAAR